MSVSDYLDDSPCTDELSEELKAKMVELDTIVELQFYPNTPVGFLQLFHYDVDMALQTALETMQELNDVVISFPSVPKEDRYNPEDMRKTSSSIKEIELAKTYFKSNYCYWAFLITLSLLITAATIYFTYLIAIL
jgi:hypothetical protein